MVFENVVCVETFVCLGNVASSKYGISEKCSFVGNEVSVFAVGCGFCRKQGVCSVGGVVFVVSVVYVRKCALCRKCDLYKKCCLTMNILLCRLFFFLGNLVSVGKLVYFLY